MAEQLMRMPARLHRARLSTYITEQTKIRPVFKLKTFKSKGHFASPAAGGTAIIADGDTTESNGRRVRLRNITYTDGSTEMQGYDFISWTSGGNIVSRKARLVTDETPIRQTAGKTSWKNLTFTPAMRRWQGQARLHPDGYGDTINLTAVPAEGYMFDHAGTRDDAGGKLH